MPDIEGVSIAEVTAFGWSQDGRHVWIAHRLRDGSEYRLVYPYVAAGQLVTLFIQAVRAASAQRMTQNPREAAAGMDTNVMPVEEVRVGTTPEASAAILHMTTADDVPIAVELPMPLLEDLSGQLQQTIQHLRSSAAGKRRPRPH
jgi:hypothetical protein